MAFLCTDISKWFYIACASLCGSILLTKYLNSLNKPVKSVVRVASETHCYFLTDSNIRGSNYLVDSWNMLNPVVEFIQQAQLTLDICFYLITDYTVVSAILDAKKRNVNVKLITDYTSGILNNKYARYFYRDGVRIYSKRCNPGQTIMHNKFLIRDNNTVLHASMNLTKNTSKGSFDNFIITTDEYMVLKYQEHFQYLVAQLSVLKL